jgi:dihydrofolate reductase
MWNLITLDGFFEGTKSWELDWLQYAWGDATEQHSIEQLHTADLLLFGRTTYEGMAAYWQSAEGEIAGLMNGLPKVVVSKTLGQPTWANTTLVEGDPAVAVRQLKDAGDRNILVFGSAILSATLLEQGLFDEIRLGIVPVIVGRGRTLFGRDLSLARMKLLDSRALPNGLVILRYEPLAAE